MSINEVISAQGKGFELSKAFLYALEQNGGDTKDLTTYLGSESLQKDIARRIIGGPWISYGDRLVVEIDWSKSISDMVETESKIQIRNGVYKSAVPSKETIFECRSIQVPESGITRSFYKIIQAPKEENPEDLSFWFNYQKERQSLHGTEERELLAFAREYFQFPDFELLATGVFSREGYFPSIENGHLGWHGFDPNKEFPRKTFLLYRDGNHRDC